ncbi:DNA-binding CsgD family transcriptional regulator [Hoeflea halophila]|uniref:DNA-binding CsgD family transcriptional regulator n=2 Tax=Hoeflea halophila TaxID=714899 RepID=A0A286I0H4_9HYPH|nr:DNA-binding CsgD family transcriptional regulator [Hoeflea halophila]
MSDSQMMPHLSNPAFSNPLLESVGRIRTIHDAKQVLREACAQYGFRHFVVISLPGTISRTQRSLAQLAVVSSWPAELTAEFDRLELASDSPMLNEMQTRISPVLLDMSKLKQELSTQKLIAAIHLFSRFELTTGVGFPVQDSESKRYAVCFLGDREPLSDEKLSTLGMLSTMLIDRISQISSDRNEQKPVLNAREIEVLRWTAEGKTSSEISRLTGLSEHTVNHYATISTKKLGCANRTQAVVKVMRMGLFR